MSATEKERADALLASQAGRPELQEALVRAAGGEGEEASTCRSPSRKARWTSSGTGPSSAQMRVEIGPEVTVGQAPGARKITPPLGSASVAAVVDASYAWDVPRGSGRNADRPPPRAARIKGGLGSLAVLLDDGTPIYSRPAAGPLADESYVLPGGVRADAADLEAIRENLSAGHRRCISTDATPIRRALPPALSALVRFFGHGGGVAFYLIGAMLAW